MFWLGFLAGVVVGVILVAFLATRKERLAFKALPAYEQNARKLDELAYEAEMKSLKEISKGWHSRADNYTRAANGYRKKAKQLREIPPLTF